MPRFLDKALFAAEATAVFIGLGALFGGCTAFVAGSAGEAVIWLGDYLKPHRKTLCILQTGGLLILGFGMTATGAMMLVNLVEDRWSNEDKKPQDTIPVACQGCRCYHGKTYGGNYLVCGIHPYGWEGKSCPDFAKEEQL